MNLPDVSQYLVCARRRTGGGPTAMDRTFPGKKERET